MDDLLRVAVVLGLVAANAFFVIGEYAVVTARRGRLRQQAEAGKRGARSALRLMDDPVRVISTVQVGITAIGILTGAIGEPLVRDLLGGDLPTWFSFLIAFTTVTFLTVVLGELVPKALTLDRAEHLGIIVSPPIELIAKALRPVVWLLESSAGLLLKPLGIREVTAGEGIGSPDELRALVDEAEEAGVIAHSEEEMLHNVLQLGGREACDVMVPAHEVVWLDASSNVEEALGVAIASPHERYPVASGNLNRLIGVVHMRDLVAASLEDSTLPVEAASRPPFIVPETKELSKLLQEQRDRRQLAIVVDEYGTTTGIVSLEDVVESIVGAIEDEHDRLSPDEQPSEEGVFEVRGSMTVDEFNSLARTNIRSSEGTRTLGGIVFVALGRRPFPGDTVIVADAELSVREMDGQRIEKLAVRVV